MGLPSKRRTKSSKRRRSSHFRMQAGSFMPCSNCGKPVRPHYVCMACGVYQGKTVLKVQSAGDKKLRKREKQRAAESASKETAKEAEPAK